MGNNYSNYQPFSPNQPVYVNHQNNIGFPQHQPQPNY